MSDTAVSWRNKIDIDKAFDCEYCKGLGKVCDDYEVEDDGSFTAVGISPCGACQPHITNPGKFNVEHEAVNL